MAFRTPQGRRRRQPLLIDLFLRVPEDLERLIECIDA